MYFKIWNQSLKGVCGFILVVKCTWILCWGRRLLKFHSWGQEVLDVPSLGQEVCGFLHLRTRGTWVLFLHKGVREVLFCDWRGTLKGCVKFSFVTKGTGSFVLWPKGCMEFCFVTKSASISVLWPTVTFHIPEVISSKILFLCMNAVGLSSCLQYILIKMTIIFHFEFIKLLIFGNL